MHSCTEIFLTIEAVITLLHYILHKVILFFLLPILPKGECINGKEKTVACKQPQEQANGVLITSTHNVRLNGIKNQNQIWIKIVNIVMCSVSMSRIYELLFQPLWLRLWQKKMTKYCTELQWANGREHILGVNQGLFHRIEQKDHELYLLLPSLQPTTLPTAFF